MNGAGAVTMSEPSVARVVCKDLRSAIDCTADQVSLSFPRSCVSNPRWVQVTVGAASTTDTDVFVDNGQNTSHDEPTPWSVKIFKA